MRRSFSLIVLLAGFMASYAATAAVTSPSDAELKACFQAHSQSMEKPGLKNWVTCWRAHGRWM